MPLQQPIAPHQLKSLQSKGQRKMGLYSDKVTCVCSIELILNGYRAFFLRAFLQLFLSVLFRYRFHAIKIAKEVEFYRYESAKTITALYFPENPVKVHWNFYSQNRMKIKIIGNILCFVFKLTKGQNFLEFTWQNFLEFTCKTIAVGNLAWTQIVSRYCSEVPLLSFIGKSGIPKSLGKASTPVWWLQKVRDMKQCIWNVPMILVTCYNY